MSRPVLASASTEGILLPSRAIVARELATLFGVVSNPDRVRIVEEPRGGERDVTTLQEALGCPAPRVSQHLSTLRAHRIVQERREGRRV